MNTDNLNKSQVEIMCDKINTSWNRVHARFMNLSDSMKRIGLNYDVQYKVLDHAEKHNRTISNVFDRVFGLAKAFYEDRGLCAYCCNNLDHNLGDHKLAVERQRITNQMYEDIDKEESEYIPDGVYDWQEDEFFVPLDIYDVWKNSKF